MKELITPEILQAAIGLLSLVMSGGIGVVTAAVKAKLGAEAAFVAQQGLEIANNRLKRGIENAAAKRGILDLTEIEEMDDRRDVATAIALEVAEQMPDTVKALKASTGAIVNIVPAVLAKR